MARITGLNDEHSDYGITRRVLGAAGVLGFGAAVGYGITRVNNSAYLRSLGKRWQKRDYAGKTGSILFSGSALHTSELVKQSIENTARLGTSESNRKATLKEMNDKYISRKDGFLDRLMKRHEELLQQRELEKSKTLDIPQQKVKVPDLNARQNVPKSLHMDLQDFHKADFDKILGAMGSAPDYTFIGTKGFLKDFDYITKIIPYQTN